MKKHLSHTYHFVEIPIVLKSHQEVGFEMLLEKKMNEATENPPVENPWEDRTEQLFCES